MKGQKNKKVITIIAASLLAAAGAWGGSPFGPKPVEAGLAQTVLSSPVSQPVPDTRSQAQDVIPNPHPAVLGFAQDSMKAGELTEPVGKYVEYLKKLYEGRGYHTASGQSSPQKNEHQQPTNKIYWRENSDNFTMICAVGLDSDPHSNDKTAQPQIHSTVVSSNGNGGTKWLTFRYQANLSTWQTLQDATLSNADLPGEDPYGIARPAGLRRLFSVIRPSASGASVIAVYTATENPSSLVEWYMKTMSRDWQLDSLPTAQAKSLADGLICFKRGDRYCLIWVEPTSATGQTFVMVSSNYP